MLKLPIEPEVGEKVEIDGVIYKLVLGGCCYCEYKRNSYGCCGVEDAFTCLTKDGKSVILKRVDE